MEAKSILTADLLDILFENRNKEYGAYELRKTYNRRIVKAIAGMMLLCMLLIVANIFEGSKKTNTNATMFVKDYELTKVVEPKSEVKPPSVQKPIEHIAMRRNDPPIIVPDKDVTPKDEIPTIDELDNVKIGPANQTGENIDVVAAPVEQSTFNIQLGKKEENYTKEFTSVEIQAQFPGGLDAWKNYLERNLRTDLPVENGAPAGTYTVIISFLVDKEGNISEVKAENDPGYGTAEEAVRVIKKSKQWTPAMQNGNNVVYRQKQSITFLVQGNN